MIKALVTALSYVIYLVMLILQMFTLSVILDFFVGWEFQMYTISEESGSVEICMVVMITETTIQSPAVFNYQFLLGGDAIGIHVLLQ